MNSIPVRGCRHDILGHNLKAIGLLRVLSACAGPEHCDPDAEGWWELDDACFRLRSSMYHDEEKLARFLAERYCPTPILAAWNKDIGLDREFAKESGRVRDWETAHTFSSAVTQGTLRTDEAFLRYRESLGDSISAALDAISASLVAGNHDNPTLLSKGIAGRAHVLRTYWDCIEKFAKQKSNLAEDSLFGGWSFGDTKKKAPAGKGAPFFPDAIKAYNNGLGWVTETYPFNALDYLLAFEGALALRGAISRTLSVSSRRFAAFPFVFDSGEDFVDDNNEVKRTAPSIWLPLWGRPTTFSELASFICDAQARLPRKEARFSSEFARALRAQGVDAGFVGWQEFRFKMRASRVPWVCTGRYVGARSSKLPALLSDALGPLDERGFLDQFEPRWRGNKVDSRSPHPIRAGINEAIENAVAEPTPENCLEVLVSLYDAWRRLALSKTLRDTLSGNPVLFEALPQEPWKQLLAEIEEVPEFRMARALASIIGLEKQANGKVSSAQPFLGSLLPVKRGFNGWYLPNQSDDLSKQAVWGGRDICSDLAGVLWRRYLDSLEDERPALRSPYPARLQEILAFLKGELDDHRIARWAEALSLIDWHWKEKKGDITEFTVADEVALSEQFSDVPAIPVAYAALRSVLEVECEWQGNDISLWKKRRSERPIALACEQAPSSIALAIEDALRWISIWGVPDSWGEATRNHEGRLAGHAVVRVNHRQLRFGDSRLTRRISAAIAIPLDWRDRGTIFRSITLPQPKRVIERNTA